MSAPAKKTPTKAAPADITRNTKPVIDYAALSADDATMPKGVRSSILDGTPFVAWMTESRDNKSAKAVNVPENAASQTVYIIRQAAARIESGVRIVESDNPDGSVKITFQARPKRERLTPEQRAERDAERDKKRAEKAAAKAAKAAKK